MRHHRALFLAASSLTALLAAGPVRADDAPAASSVSTDNTIVVTGTRAPGRTRLDTLSPVDVITASSLRQQGSPELGTALAALVPSLDFPRPSANDGSDAIRPAVLRGLSPDETLVLINGVRAHASAYLNVNGSLGRGAASVDLNTIPDVALETVEVLRDGASAQYGSDAIAGVVNLRLKQADHGGGATVSEGIYVTDFTTARTHREVTGEPVTSASAWQGIKLGSDGFLTISGDYQHRSATNRVDADPRLTPARVDGVFGDPKVDQYSGWANFGKPVSGDWQAYGWLGYQYRNSTSAELPRLATAAATYGLGSVYPNGFVPYLNSHSFDLTSALGLKGEAGGWAIDAKVSYGRNVVKLSTLDSANYTYGAASPTHFYDGRLRYDQVVGGIDATKSFAVFKSLNVAWGGEIRHERYAIGAGDEASYAAGTAYPKASYGAQGYGGLGPQNAIDAKRTAESAYLDIEAQVTDKLRLGAAGRYEHYSDFGSTGTGKVSARYDFSPAFALRATGSTGFRAPSLQQEYYTSTSSVINSGTIQLTGTYPSTSAIATALGGKALEPERAASASAGFVARVSGLDVTVDGYYTHIRNGLALSENLTSSVLTPAAAALLTQYGVQAARFFINGLGITAQGIEGVAHYRARTADAGSFDFTLTGDVARQTVTSTPSLPDALTSLGLFGRSRILAIEEGSPGQKVIASVDWSRGPIGVTTRVTYYGNVTVAGTTAASDYSTGARAITDLELRYQPRGNGLNLALGANNLLDVYPRAVPANLNAGNYGVVAYPYYSPFGFNGRYIYVRAGLRW